MQLPKQYVPHDVEDRIYQYWLENGCFSAQVDATKQPFCIVIPPPNVTGILHMGHALNNTIQDVLVRFKRMQGYESLWMPGTDHAGIATQNVVERNLAKQGLRKEDIGREKFIEKLWEWKDQYGSTIIGQLKKLGASCDWQRQRFTMDASYSEAVKETFVRLYEKGLIYRGNYIINWCPRCRTALSDEEAAHRELDGWLYYIRYPVKKAASNKRSPDYIVVATTRPETMLGDTAVAVNPHDKRFTWLKGATVVLPIMDRELKVIEDEAIDPEFGTGIVKVTPAHDPVDFQLGKKHGLDFVNIMKDDAVLNEQAGEFSGMDRFEARAAVLEVLREKKLIEKEDPYKVSAGHCYRCHTVIEPRVSLQWFVKMKPLAKKALEVVEEDKIRFSPDRWKKVYLNWMNNIQDWCISRQIWWGHQLPVYYCRNCQEMTGRNSKSQIPNPKSEPEHGIIVAKEKPAECPYCGSTELVQDPDVLDTWFSSWLWPFATFYWPKEGNKDLEYFYPTNVLVTASEILFFWVARMIMSGLEFMGEIPFGRVLIHGTVRDAKGIKMSKSLGNVIDPLEIIGEFGADSLRFSLMLLAASGSDVYLSKEKFLVGRNFANKIWNATRFLFMKLEESGVIVEDLRVDSLGLEAPDIWVLDKLNETVVQVTESLENFRINEVTKNIYDFFWNSFCDWYIEIVKDTFNAKTAGILIWCLVTVMKLLHPVMPFLTEEIYQLIKTHTRLNLNSSVMTASWPEPLPFTVDEASRMMMARAIEMIRVIRNLKVDLGISPAQKIVMKVSSRGDFRRFFEDNLIWINRLGGIERVEFVDRLRRILFKGDGVELDFLIDDIDRDRFMQSLDKKVTILDGQCDRIVQKLRNEKFLKNAPEDTVLQQKERFEQLSGQRQRLEELREALKG
ncbi:MAG: valine--tRNA ligase [Candidatus Omnitrophica bacterium]|nr:valine--tRNA ligase [Candidatus Omnitrophota bacterium]